MLSILEIIGICFAAVILLIVIGIIFQLAYVRSFRKNCGAEETAKFYVNEDKFVGRIIRRMGDQCYVEYIDENNKRCQRSFHIDQLYPS